MTFSNNKPLRFQTHASKIPAMRLRVGFFNIHKNPASAIGRYKQPVRIARVRSNKNVTCGEPLHFRPNSWWQVLRHNAPKARNTMQGLEICDIASSNPLVCASGLTPTTLLRRSPNLANAQHDWYLTRLEKSHDDRQLR